MEGKAGTVRAHRESKEAADGGGTAELMGAIGLVATAAKSSLCGNLHMSDERYLASDIFY